jgi:glutathione synthase/RimK-type ligase-like ATP-grasp enzyme
MKKIFVLKDYRGQFYFSTKSRGASVDLDKLSKKFFELGYEIVVKNYYEIDFRKDNYLNEWVLYQSSEDPDVRYKDYIEDIILGLQIQGAKLIPEFKYFRAHHNKVFMEVLRDLLPIDEIKNIKSNHFGTYEEYQKSGKVNSPDTHVFKLAAGSGSRSVALLKNTKSKVKIPFNSSRTFTLDNFRLWINKIKTGRNFVPMSNNRKKFIIQNFTTDVTGDFRVIVYGDKYYTVFRKNRKNDFRASGSGIFESDPDIPAGLFDYAKSIYSKLNTPYVTLDIAHKNGEFYLFEFQCICLGQLFFEKSKHYYKQESDGVWNKYHEEPDLEREISKTVVDYINNY